MKIAVYARCSTKKDQDPETQLFALREYARSRGFEIIEEYVDAGQSGSKESRPALDRMMEDARSRRFGAVVVARFDRFARSTSHLIRGLEELRKLGIDFISINENIDTSTPMGKMVFTVISAVAELERNIIVERTLAGLARANAAGRHGGRRPRIFDRERLVRLRDDGMSWPAIARALKISKDTARKGYAEYLVLTRGPGESAESVLKSIAENDAAAVECAP